jgi:stage II sporulation protein AA (anti-sigma F factor antagonist)
VALEIQIADEQGVAVVAAAGAIDSKSAPELEKVLVKLLGEKKREIVLDLARLDYVASAGLRVFVMIGKRLQADGGRLALCSVNPSVMKVLEVSGFVALFAIRPSRQDAVDWLTSGAKVARISSLAGEILRKDGGAALPRPTGAPDPAKSAYAKDLLSTDTKRKRK